ncbi:MAG: LysR family transcriptional regulator [Pseudomonadota bacterium]
MNWDDLKVASAIHQRGSYAKAAQQLGLNETTIARRLARLETELGAKVFESIDGERTPTEAGRHVLETVRRMKAESARLKHIGDKSRTIVRRRIASVEAMATHYLAPTLPSLIKDHPHLQVEILLSTELASFSRWETDIALRLVRPDRGNAIMKKLSEFEWVLVKPRELEPHFMCGYTSQHVQKREREVLRSHLPGVLPLTVVNGMSPMKRILMSGQGVGFLPDFMCGDLWDSETLSLTPLDLYRPVWLLVQEHLRNDPDTRLVTDWLEASFASGKSA